MQSQEGAGLFLSFAHSFRFVGVAKGRACLLAASVALAAVLVHTEASLASTIYDSNILQRMTFTPEQRGQVRDILEKSDREMAVIFRKYGINPHAKPDFDKLQSASGELQAMETREKRAMKKILTTKQYKTYLKLLQNTAARVIKATRTEP